MKLDLSLNSKKFKEEVENLRRDLSQIKEKGNSDINFEKKLNDLEKKEKRLLEEIIPYMRSLNKFRSTVNLKQLKNSGPYEFKGFLRKYEKINENLYIISNNEKKTYLLNIDGENIFLSEEIKSLKNKKITEIIKAKDNIYVFTNKGEIQIFETKDNKNINIVKTAYTDKSWDKAVYLYDNIFLASTDEKIYMIEIDEEVKISENNIKIENLSDYALIKDKLIGAITESGFLYIIKYSPYNIEIKNKIYLEDSLSKIEVLENSNSDRKSMAIIGNKGKVFIISLYNYEIEEQFKLEGNLFGIKSKKGTAVILSDSGIIYIAEENFLKWDIRESLKSNKFYTDIIERRQKQYILADLDSNFYSLDISRITEVKDLENIALY